MASNTGWDRSCSAKILSYLGDLIKMRKRDSVKKDPHSDRALDLLHVSEYHEMDKKAQNALLKKLDWRPMPLLCITYAL